MPVPATIAIAIITYQRPDELEGVLDNLLAQERLPDEIVVIDNDPERSGRQAAQIAHPLVSYHCPGKNLGVAAGRNFAVANAHSDIVLFIDDDARFAQESALRSVLAMFEDETVACVALLVRNAFSGEILPKEYPGYRPDNWQQSHDVSYFVGCGFAVRRQLFQELGGLDETLFYDGEELEFSYRLLNHGGRIRYTPDAAVLHRTSVQGRGLTKNSYWLLRNRVYVALKHLPLPYLLSYLGVWSAFAFYKALRTRDLSNFFRGLRSLRAEGLLARAREYRRQHPMQKSTLSYLRQHQGRLFY